MTSVQKLIDKKRFNLQSMITNTNDRYIIVSSAEKETIPPNDYLRATIPNVENSNKQFIKQEMDTLTVNDTLDESKLVLAKKYLKPMKYEKNYYMGAHILFAETYDSLDDLDVLFSGIYDSFDKIVLSEIDDDTISELYFTLQSYIETAEARETE